MALYPEIQRRAQEELDRVVGPNRLPEFSDLVSLAYVRAIALECLRWMPPLPLGVPHQSMEDDQYNGMFIPKGTAILAVSVGLLYPRVYLLTLIPTIQNVW